MKLLAFISALSCVVAYTIAQKREQYPPTDILIEDGIPFEPANLKSADNNGNLRGVSSDNELTAANPAKDITLWWIKFQKQFVSLLNKNRNKKNSFDSDHGSRRRRETDGDIHIEDPAQVLLELQGFLKSNGIPLQEFFDNDKNLQSNTDDFAKNDNIPPWAEFETQLNSQLNNIPPNEKKKFYSDHGYRRKRQTNRNTENPAQSRPFTEEGKQRFRIEAETLTARNFIRRFIDFVRGVQPTVKSSKEYEY